MLLRKLVTVLTLWLSAWFNPKTEIISPQPDLVYVETVKVPTTTIVPTPSKIVVKLVPTIIPTPKALKVADTSPWGVAQQIDDVTWTMRIQQDEKMGTAEEVLDALNKYRLVHGSGILHFDEKLNNYALERAKYFTKEKKLDGHKGFRDKLENEKGFEELGFWALGENASYGYILEAVHLIEWMYAGDKPHNDNQLDKSWTHVGIGIDGVSTVLIFGKHKI
jgi:uncharacterized protein YkwD